MPVEIERKFLVKEELVPETLNGIRMVQAYLCTDPERTVRVRIANNQAFLTIKGALTGISRSEFEYMIPVNDAHEMLKLAVSFPVEKVRKEIYFDGKKWEIDFFEGQNSGLILAEVELGSDDEVVSLPEWVTQEVSDDMRYHNSQLSKYPYNQWE